MLDSILSQSIKDVEVIVVDDASEMCPADIVAAYRNKGLGISLLPSPKRVHTKDARLLGVTMATADCIMFADADDRLWGEQALESHVALMRANDADIVHFRTVFTDENGIFTGYFHLADPFSPSLSGSPILERFLQQDSWGAVIWNKLFSRRLLVKSYNDIQALDILRCEDLFMNLVTMFNAQSYIASDLTGYGYHYINKRKDTALARAMSVFSIMEFMLPFFAKNGVPASMHQLLVASGMKRMSVLAGRACMEFTKDGHGFPDAEAVGHLLQDVDVALLVKTLLMGNAINASKMTSMYTTLTSGS